MKRRNFLASLVGLFAVMKIPEVTIFHRQRLDGAFLANKRIIGDYYYHSQFKRWVKIKAAEEIDVGALVKIDKNGLAKECYVKDHEHNVGICMINNWPEDVMVALFND